MAVTKSQSAVQWAGSSTDSVASGGTETSDAQSISSNAIAGSVSIKVDHGGTPASGDVVEVRILYSNGDLPGLPDGSDEFDQPESAVVFDFVLTEDDPAILTTPIDVSASAFKIQAENTGASSVTISANYGEQVNS